MIIETVQNPTQGLKSAKKVLYKNVDRKTALFLSGGSTPKLLYKNIALEKNLIPGAVAMVDERYGSSLHKDSNERMIKETGFLSYLSKQKIPFYFILSLGHKNLLHHVIASPDLSGSGDLQSGRRLLRRLRQAQASRNDKTYIVDNYDKKVKYLFSRFQKHVAVLGIGEDGHIAGLPAKTQNSKLKTQNYVIGISDFPGEFKQRITLTFNALSKMDLLIVLVFGSSKKNALNLILTPGLEEEVPARFFNRPDIAKKTILITDQKLYNNY